MHSDFKRWCVAVLVGMIGVSACGGTDDSTEDKRDEGTAATVTATHAFGDVQVPADPQRIVALDELAGLAAVSAGREPEVVFASLGDTATADILREEGIEVREAEVLSLPSNEEILTFDPDLIVGTGAEGPAGLAYDDLSDIATTVVIDIEGSWRDLTINAAAAFGAPEVGERQVAAIETQLTAAAATSGGQTLSLIGFTTQSFTMPPHSPSSTLIAEAGFTRPQVQQEENDSYSTPFSPEFLLDHDADIIVVPDGPGADASSLTDLQLYGQLTGKTVHPVAGQWYGNSAFSFFVIAHDLASLASGSTDVTTSDELMDLWGEFRAETSAS